MHFASLCIGWGSPCMCAIWVCRSAKERTSVDCTAYVAVFRSIQDLVMVVLTEYLGSAGGLSLLLARVLFRTVLTSCIECSGLP
jgi:ABC-type arginine transport system permease subunit